MANDKQPNAGVWYLRNIDNLWTSCRNGIFIYYRVRCRKFYFRLGYFLNLPKSGMHHSSRHRLWIQQHRSIWSFEALIDGRCACPTDYYFLDSLITTSFDASEIGVSGAQTNGRQNDLMKLISILINNNLIEWARLCMI